MSVPGIVRSTLGDEQVAAQISLGGEDELYVTPTRTIIYRGEGLLSDETVETYGHAAERVVVSTGRRKARITLEDSVEGDQSFTIPPDRLEDALHPVLAGVLNAAGVSEPGETVKRTFRFSELTLIVTSRRLVKHIGEAVWDTDYEEFHYEDATGLDFEEGSVATQIVLDVGGRRERIKAPNERAPELRAELEEAICEFHDVGSIAEFEEKVAPEDEEPEDADEPEEEDDVSFDSGLSPLDTVGDDDSGAAGVDDAGADDSGADAGEAILDVSTGSEGAAVDDVGEAEDISNAEVARRLDELTGAVREQNELLARHADTIERLIEELKNLS